MIKIKEFSELYGFSSINKLASHLGMSRSTLHQRKNHDWACWYDEDNKTLYFVSPHEPDRPHRLRGVEL